MRCVCSILFCSNALEDCFTTDLHPYSYHLPIGAFIFNRDLVCSPYCFHVRKGEGYIGNTACEKIAPRFRRDEIMEIYALILSAVLVSSYILEKNLYLNLFSNSSDPVDKAIDFSLATAFILILSSSLVYALYKYVFFSSELKTFTIILTFISIEMTTRAIYFISQRTHPSLSEQQLPFFLPLTLINPAILGAILINLSRGLDYPSYIEQIFLSGIAFSIFLISFIAAKERISHSDIPKPFQGLPIYFVTIGLVALGSSGFKEFLN